MLCLFTVVAKETEIDLIQKRLVKQDVENSLQNPLNAQTSKTILLQLENNTGIVKALLLKVRMRRNLVLLVLAIHTNPEIFDNKPLPLEHVKPEGK